MPANDNAKETSKLIEQLAENVSAIRPDESLEDYKARMHSNWLMLVGILRNQHALMEGLEEQDSDAGSE